MKIQNNQFLSIEQLQDRYLTGNGRQVQNSTLQDGLSFQDILTKKTEKPESEEVKFSKHAAGRLVIVDSFAFIVNVPNNTVITAMSQAETNDSVFTNIDGAVII